MGNKSKTNGKKQDKKWLQRRNLAGARVSSGWSGLMPPSVKFAVKKALSEAKKE